MMKVKKIVEVNSMEYYRLVLKRGRGFRIGLNSYTYKEAVERQKQCKSTGINFLIMSEKELFS